VNIKDPEDPTVPIKLQEFVLENFVLDSGAPTTISSKKVSEKIVKKEALWTKRK
jgi:hypothetical protein